MPADKATNVAVGSNIVLTFSETILKGSGTETITLTPTSGRAIIIPVRDGQVTVRGAVATINLTNNLARSMRYSVTIQGGAFKDAANNRFAGISNANDYAFTTAP